MTLRLTHSHADGTLLDGTAKGDGSAEALRGATRRWRWSRTIGLWYVQRSRDLPPDRELIRSTRAALEAAGFELTVEIDDMPRPTAEVVADQRERSADRAEALHAKAQRQASAAEAHHEQVEQLTANRPLGQPILIGHHSEARARRDQAKIEQGMDRWAQGRAEARETEGRAEAAEANARRRESRRTVENRVRKLRADVARDLRTLHGHWRRWGETQTWVWDDQLGRHVNRPVPVDPDSDHGRELGDRIAHATEQRLYWAGVLEEMPAPPPKPTKPVKGDRVEVDGAWLPVVRSSKHDVTVSWPSEERPQGTRRVPWGRISGWDRTSQGVA